MLQKYITKDLARQKNIGPERSNPEAGSERNVVCRMRENGQAVKISETQKSEIACIPDWEQVMVLHRVRHKVRLLWFNEIGNAGPLGHGGIAIVLGWIHSLVIWRRGVDRVVLLVKVQRL